MTEYEKNDILKIMLHVTETSKSAIHDMFGRKRKPVCQVKRLPKEHLENSRRFYPREKTLTLEQLKEVLIVPVIEEIEQGYQAKGLSDEYCAELTKQLKQLQKDLK